MRNYWTDKFRVGKRVRYIGSDSSLYLKCGQIVYKEYGKNWVDVDFEFLGFIPQSKVQAVQTRDLELI